MNMTVEIQQFGLGECTSGLQVGRGIWWPMCICIVFRHVLSTGTVLAGTDPQSISIDVGFDQYMKI